MGNDNETDHLPTAAVWMACCNGQAAGLIWAGRGGRNRRGKPKRVDPSRRGFEGQRSSRIPGTSSGARADRVTAVDAGIDRDAVAGQGREGVGSA